MLLKPLGFLFILVFPNGLEGSLPVDQPPQQEAIVDAIRNRIEAGRARQEWRAGGDLILATSALPQVYVQRDFQPIWGPDFVGRGPARDFLSYLRRAEEDGLRPGDYHLAAIDSLLAATSGSTGDEIRRRVDLELLISDAYLVFGSHLLQGRVNPEGINPEWLANRRNASLDEVLLRAAETGAFLESLEELLPPQEGYRRLRQARAFYLEVAERGGWGSVPNGPTLREGDEDPRVPALRRRLFQSGDYTPEGGEDSVVLGSETMDPALAMALRGFQERHGLDPDGALGPATLAALNISVQDRIKQIDLNLERWRWLPQDLGRRHILVNIPGYSVNVVEEGRTVLQMRAIVGRQYRQTPVFSSRMTYLVLSPFWHVPPTIAMVDKLPEIKTDPGYVATQRMTLLDAATNLAVDPTSVDWSAVTGPEFNRRYRLRQDPGPNNALGDVKFMFPNAHNVYLHDTPSRELFGRTERGFSSGCIRIQDPLALAEYLLKDNPGWTPEGIRAAVDRRVETSVTLREAIPVHIEYWTAWVTPEGILNFRTDLYGRDLQVGRALDEPPPGI